MLRYAPGITAAALHAAHAEYERRHAAPLRAAWRPHPNPRDPERPLRLGFVGPAFTSIPLGAFLLRALEHLDHRQFQVVIYSGESKRDSATARFQELAVDWRGTAGLTDERCAEQIRADRIDLLLDVAGHAPRNRLLVFARKPAPIQITWIDSVGTTGLTAMDYVLADRYLIPAAMEGPYVERVLRMPHGYVCYAPPPGAPDVGPLPAAHSGQVTFGSLNNPGKVHRQVVEIWCRILHHVSRSRLVLQYEGFDTPLTRRYYQQLFAECGMPPERVELLGHAPYGEHLRQYNRLDIALDPFPHCGGLTTCDSLWMGVPVITCPGETFASRQSLSHLSNIGLTETIAADFDQYVELAAALAQDLPRLAQIRAGLRDQMARSPLCDGKRFAENLQALLRDVWRRWVQSKETKDCPTSTTLSGG